MRFSRRPDPDENQLSPPSEPLHEALTRLAGQDTGPGSDPSVRSRVRAVGPVGVWRDRAWTVARWLVILVILWFLWRLTRGAG